MSSFMQRCSEKKLDPLGPSHNSRAASPVASRRKPPAVQDAAGMPHVHDITCSVNQDAPCYTSCNDYDSARAHRALESCLQPDSFARQISLDGRQTIKLTNAEHGRSRYGRIECLWELLIPEAPSPAGIMFGSALGRSSVLGGSLPVGSVYHIALRIHGVSIERNSSGCACPLMHVEDTLTLLLAPATSMHPVEWRRQAPKVCFSEHCGDDCSCVVNTRGSLVVG